MDSLKQTKKDQVKLATTFSYVKSIIPNIELQEFQGEYYFLVDISDFPVPIKVPYEFVGLQETFEKLNSYNDNSYIKMGFPFLYKGAILNSFESYGFLTHNREQEFVDSDLFRNNFDTIPSYLFQQYEKEKITIPHNVLHIPRDAFYNCKSSFIELPSRLEDIGPSAFWGCCNLKCLFIPESVTHIGSFAFGLCTSLEEISIPNRLEYCANNFATATNLKKIHTNNLEAINLITHKFPSVQIMSY